MPLLRENRREISKSPHWTCALRLALAILFIVRLSGAFVVASLAWLVSGISDRGLHHAVKNTHTSASRRWGIDPDRDAAADASPDTDSCLRRRVVTIRAERRNRAGRPRHWWTGYSPGGAKIA